MNDMEYLRASSGAGEPVLSSVTSERLAGNTVLKVSSTQNFPDKFICSTGRVDQDGYLMTSTMCVFYAHKVDNNTIKIDKVVNGYIDKGNIIGQKVVIKPTSEWANNFVDIWGKNFEPDGTLKNRENLKGEQGNPGSNGKSAYDIAVDLGFLGTKQEWIASLKGDTGAKGEQGEKGDTGPGGGYDDTEVLNRIGTTENNVTSLTDRMQSTEVGITQLNNRMSSHTHSYRTLTDRPPELNTTVVRDSRNTTSGLISPAVLREAVRRHQLVLRKIDTVHVGQIIISTTLDTADKVKAFYGGGTWAKWGVGRTIVGTGSSGHNVYTNAETEGGQDQVRLTVNEMPRHRHSLAFGSGGSGSGAHVPYSNNSGYVGRDYGGMEEQGGDQPHENRQSFITAHFWKRVL